MHHKDRISIRCFYIESWCEELGAPVGNVTRTSNDIKHVIEIENLSSLDYDAQLLTNLPDSPPINSGRPPTVEFAHGGKKSLVEWTATVLQVGEREKVRDEAEVHCVSVKAGSTRLKSPAFQFRRNQGVQWLQAHLPKALCITLKIT